MSISGIVIIVLAVVLLGLCLALWMFWRQLQALQSKIPSSDPAPSASQPPSESVSSRADYKSASQETAHQVKTTSAPVLGLLSPLQNQEQLGVVWGLAQAEAELGHSVLVIDTDPGMALARQLDLPLTSGVHGCESRLSVTSCTVPKQLFGEVQTFSRQYDRILLCLPALGQPDSAEALACAENVLLVLSLTESQLSQLEATCQQLSQLLDPVRQRFWGIQISQFDPQDPFAQNLYQHISEHHPELLLAAPAPSSERFRSQQVMPWAQDLIKALPDNPLLVPS